MEFTRQQEKQLDRMLKERGIDKQTFLRQQLAQQQAQEVEVSNLLHRCVQHPTDPVTGKKRVKSTGHYGLHFSAPYGIWPFRKRRVWAEQVYRPVIFKNHAGGKHATLSSPMTMWASIEVRA